MSYKRIIYLSVFFLTTACSGEKEREQLPEWDTQKSTKMNRDFSEDERIQIQLFTERHPEWKFTRTGTGLQYYIYDSTKNEPIKPGMLATVKFKISLLDGTLCYETKEDEIEEFRVERSDIESGVQEGIQKMRAGEKALLIIPSHRAHGLLGDLNKIPPLTPILVELSVLSAR